MAGRPEKRDPLGDVDAFAVLGDPRRRRLYDYVVAQRRAVGRDEAAESTGLGRPLAAYHLDRLVEAGLLAVVFARRSGRAGPGAGRPAKHYVRAHRPLAARTHARDYAFVAALLAGAVGRAAPDVREAAADAARAEGRRLGAELAAEGGLERALAARGYEPRHEGDGTLRLGNCPFRAVAAEHPQLVCGLNQAFVQGLLDGAGAGDRVAELDPCDDCCCVAVRARRS